MTVPTKLYTYVSSVVFRFCFDCDAKRIRYIQWLSFTPTHYTILFININLIIVCHHKKTELLLRHTTFSCSTNGIFSVRTRIVKHSRLVIFSIRHSLSSPFFLTCYISAGNYTLGWVFSNVFKYHCLLFYIWTNARQRFL